MTELVEAEQRTYEQGGRVTYFAHDYLLDTLTDTTERAPTFMLPPFRPADDKQSPPSWAFLKHPYLDTHESWRRLLRRTPRGLSWDGTTYRELGAPENVCKQPPRLGDEEVYRFQIGH